MGRIQDALRKAAEERERKRRRPVGEGAEGESAPAATAPRAAAGSRSDVEAEADRMARIRRLTPVLPVDPAGPLGLTGEAMRRAQAEQEASRERERARREAPPDVDGRLVVVTRPRDPQTEQIRAVRASLLALDPVPRSMLLTAGSPGEAKSVAIANLAACLVEGGRRRCLIIDADLRRPFQHVLLRAKSHPGLSEVLAGRAEEVSECVHATPVAGVDLMPAGSILDNPGSLILPRTFSGVLGLLEGRYDFILVDAPALEGVADAAVLAPEVDGVVVVVEMGEASRARTERAVEVLDQARARLLGAIALNCEER
jgi:protein-tyrosine kinase